MSAPTQFQRSLSEHLQVIERMRELAAPIEQAGVMMAAALQRGGTIFWCGNGGSAADSQHLAAELTGRFNKDRRALRSIALTTDSSVLTCVSNDYGYADAFARQVQGLARPGDVLVGISTSGNSDNVLRAIDAARAMGVVTVGLLGKDGGRMKGVDHALVVPSNVTARIQEAHILIGHVLCEVIERELGLD